MALWLIGIISILFGSMEQFLINESQIIAVVILLAGIIVLFIVKKKNVELSIWQLNLFRPLDCIYRTRRINCRDGYCINYCGSVEHQIG